MCIFEKNERTFRQLESYIYFRGSKHCYVSKKYIKWQRTTVQYKYKKKFYFSSCIFKRPYELLWDNSYNNCNWVKGDAKLFFQCFYYYYSSRKYIIESFKTKQFCILLSKCFLFRNKLIKYRTENKNALMLLKYYCKSDFYVFI